MARKRYTVWIEANPSILADIEKGGPIRKFESKSLIQAIGMANLALFTAGKSMRAGMRSMELHSSYVHHESETLVIRIQCNEAR